MVTKLTPDPALVGNIESNKKELREDISFLEQYLAENTQKIYDPPRELRQCQALIKELQSKLAGLEKDLAKEKETNKYLKIELRTVKNGFSW